MAREAKQTTAETTEPVMEPSPKLTAWKGFDRDLKCRDFQYAIGETYRAAADVEKIIRCAGPGGFHSCEMPLDCFSYYGPADSRYAEVEIGGQIARGGDREDSKLASAEITIKAEINLPAIVRAAVAWVMERAKGNRATGYRGHAAATGYSGHAAATGKDGIAASLGVNATAMAGPDGWLVLAAWRRSGDRYELLHVRASKVGGPEGVKPNLKYRLTEAGEFEEARS